MNTFKLTVATPDGQKFSGTAQSVSLRTTEGDVMILAGHTDFLGAVAVGICKIVNAEGVAKTASAAGGVITVKGGVCNLLATTFEFEDEIDLERAKNAKERAEEALRHEKDEKKMRIAEAKLARALNRITIAEKTRGF